MIDFNERLDQIRGNMNEPPMNGGLDFNDRLEKIRGSGQPIILNDAQMAVINDVDERERGPAPETFDPLSLSDWGNKVAAPLGISAGRMITDTALGGGGLVLGNLGMDEAAKWLLNKNVDVSDWWSGLNASTAGENPHFVSDVASGVGSSLGFMLAGAGAMGAASKLGRVGQLAAGAFTEGGLEALTEAGGFLTEAQAQGQYDKGLSAANKSFVSNAGLNMLLNLAGGRYNPYLDKIPGFAGWLAKTAAEVGEEALLQEPLQGVIESAASKTLQNGGDFLPNLWESLKEYPEILQQVGPSSAASTALIQALFGVAGMGQAVTKTDQTVANPEQDVTQTEQIVATPEQDVAQTEQRPPIDFNERLAQVREQIREQLKESAGQETETETEAEADTPIARMKQDVVKLRESATRSREEAQKRGDTNEVKILDKYLENLDNYEKELDAEAAQETKAKPGKTAKVRTAAGTEVDTVYRIKSADDLVTSDNASYPAELQPRQRDRAASQKQVDGIANKLDPTLLGESRLASDGAPIVGADGIVESGNGRVMGIRKAYQHGKAEGYQSWLRENAGAFGLSDADFEGVNNPVLVRERTGDVDRAKFAMEANESSVAQMSRTERAMSDAKKMTPDILGRFNPEKSVANNRDFLEDFARTVIPQNELGAFFDANGNLSQEGEQRVRDALFAAAYGDPDVMSRVAESLDNDVKNVTHAMLEAAPKIAAMEKAMEGGGLHQELSIKRDITDAVKTLAALKAEGNTVENYLAQMTLPGTEDAEISPEAKALLNFFNKNRRSAKAIAEGLGRYAELATAEGSPDQVRMFGEDEAPRRTKRDVLRQALNGEEAPRAPKKASNAREAIKDELRREIRGKQEGYDDEYAEAWAEAATTLVESEAKSRGISVDDVAKEWGLEVVKDPEGEGIPTGDVYEQIGRKRKMEMDAQLAKKRPDLSPEQRAATIDAIERLGEETRQGGNPKLEKAATYWALNGHINMAQENDVNKIKRAIEVCEQHGLDPMSFKDPNTILSEYEYKEKAERLDPDDVFAFSNKQTFSDGITVYDVQDDLEGQQAVRAIIDTHWGENANPWCLAAGHDLDGHGDAWRMWENYSGTDKRIAFKDGKLLAFCASEDDTVTWWDREDEAHSGIPYIIKKDGNKTYYRYNEERGQSLKIREELKDGTERHYWDNGQMSSEIKANGERRRYRENGNMYYEVIPGEVTRVWHDNGQLRREAWANGITKEYNEDGSPVEEKKPTPRQNNEYLGQELKFTVLDTGEEIYQQSIGEKGAASLDAADAGQRMDNLGVARDMEKSGKDAKAIRMATGWERGTDGKWRYEILDGEFSLRGFDKDTLAEYDRLEKRLNETEPGSAEWAQIAEEMHDLRVPHFSRYTEDLRLMNIYNAPELYAAYPDLRMMKVRLVDSNELGGVTGQYNPQTDSIALSDAVSESKMGKVLVHEIQHAIQHREGFAKGGRQEMFTTGEDGLVDVGYYTSENHRQKAKELWDKLSPEAKKIAAQIELAQNAKNWDLMNELEAKLSKEEQDILWKRDGARQRAYDIDQKGDRTSPKGAYHRLSGETEARNASKRMEMTPEERRATLLAETEDVSREDQIVLMNANWGAESSSNPDTYKQIIGERGATRLDATDAGNRIDNLGVARKMEKAGKDTKTIRLATGWERGADGKWRYEILDGKLTERGELLEKATNGQISTEEFMRHMEIEESAKGTIIRLPDFYDAPELYAAYRKLKSTSIKMQNAPITEDGMIKINELAHYDPFTNTITLTAGVPNSNFKSLLVHEIQHAVQIIEGFDTGEGFTGDRDKYKKQAGETEARNAERRMDMSAEARRKTLLAETEDVAREDQIILRDALGAGNNARAYTRFQREVKNDAGEIIQEAKTIIGILKNADKSSPIHELGHVWMDRMRRMAQMEGIPQDVKDDWKILTDWLRLRGIDFSKDLSGEDLKRWQDAQEKFAAGWEKYFATGKAPNKRLQGVFDKFKQWMKEIYQAVKNITWHGKDGKEHRFNLPQDVRRVMDRMLTPEERMGPGGKTVADLAGEAGERIEASLPPKEDPRHLGAVAPGFRPKVDPKTNPHVETAEPAQKHAFTNPETEARYTAAKEGVPPEGRVARTIKAVKEFLFGLKGDFPMLADNKDMIAARETLRRLNRARGVAANNTVTMMRDSLKNLSPEDFELFARKRLLDDLNWRKEKLPDAALPFGFTDRSLAEETARFNKLVEGNERVKKAIQAEGLLMRGINDRMIELADELGWTDLRNKLRNPHYYKHQVLEYAQTRDKEWRVGVRAPTDRGYLKKYKGSEKDINANYIQANGEVRGLQMQDIAVLEALVELRDKYDISARLHEEAEKQGKKIKDVIPEGYVRWTPFGRGLVFSADAAAQQALDAALADGGRQLGLPFEDMAGMMDEAQGSAYKSKMWVIPAELAATLNRMGAKKERMPAMKVVKEITSAWKSWILYTPTRVLNYNIRNVTGDLDAFIAGNPRGMKFLSQSMRELSDLFFKGRAATGELHEFQQRGGALTTESVQELYDWKQMREFQHLMDEMKGKGPKDWARLDKKAWALIDGYWKGAERLTNFREQILRYATYLSYLEQMKSNKEGRPDNWGASNRDEVMGVEDIRDRAFKMSNELLGAYDQVSQTGQQLRDISVPFYSWLEVNAKRYYNLLKNGFTSDAVGDFAARLLRAQVVKSPLYAYRAAKTILMVNLFMWAVQAFNRFVMGDDDDDLTPDVKERPHITLGRTSDGRVLYFDRIGAMADVLDWFALDSFWPEVKDILNGQQTVAGYLKKMGSAPFSKAMNAVNPVIKTPYELAMGRTIYPDMGNPRMIRDVGGYIASSLGLSWEYRTAAGEPGPKYFSWDRIRGLFTYSQDAYEGAYFYILDRKREFQERVLGKTFDGFATSKRGNALRRLKTALRFKDQANVDRALKEYAAAGGTRKGLKVSMQNMDPLHGLNKQEKKQFYNWLSEEDRKFLTRAMKYYRGLPGGLRSPSK